MNVKASNRTVTFIDLFSGSGLFTHAFRAEGFIPIQAVELCPKAAETYRSNVGKHITIGDVTKSSPIGKTDLLIGGPPCQGFSTLGKRDSSDPRNDLCFEMVRWAKLSDAKVVVVENVGAFTKSKQYATLNRKFEKLGYKTVTFVLNAADFGVPQIRVRSFTIASKIGLPTVPLPCKLRKTAKEAFRNLPRINGTDPLHQIVELSELARSRISILPRNGGKKDIMELAPHLVPDSWWKIPNQAADVWRRMDWDAPSNTIRTAFTNPSKGRYIHPSKHRVITLREACRLHSVPDKWVFKGDRTSVARQIGNSVPPKLGRAIAREILALFLP